MINIKKKVHPNLLNIFKQNILTNYRIIIKLKQKSNNIINKIKKNTKCELIHFIDELNILCAIVTHKTLSNLIESPEVIYISNDPEVYLCGNISFPEFEKSTSFDTSTNIKLTGKHIRVGIIDSGIYPTNVFIKPKNRIVFFRDLVNNFSHPYDDNGHGTCMCNIIGGNFIFKNSILKNASECDFCVIKAFDRYNKSYCSLIFKSLDILFENSIKFNIQVLCLPFEIQEFNDFILKIFQNIIDKFSKYNIIAVIPIGNNTSKYCSIKGLSLLNNCLIVGGDNYKESSKGIFKSKILKPNISSIYENVYIQNIDTKYIPERNNEYIYPTKSKNSLLEFFGTSCSCAYISSLIVLLKQKNSALQINDLLSLLKISCNKIDEVDNSIQGLGIINLNQLLE